MTRNADPMAFQIISAVAILVPVVNTWALIPKFRTKVAAMLGGIVLPIVAMGIFLWR